MSFAWPWIFLALPLPWLLRAVLAPAAAGPALRLPRLPAMSAISTGAGRPALPHAVAALAWLLLLAAAARPQLPGAALPATAGARSLMLAFDVSMSMTTADLQQDGKPVDRLQAARGLAARFLAGQAGDRAGLVVFGSQAYLHTPMTADLAAVHAALGGVQPGLAGRETALGDAIALGVKYLKTQPPQDRMLVLLTDGANTAGTLAPQRAAWLAQREGVRIQVLGIGAAAELDEALLRDLARRTGGSYLLATDGAAAAAFFDGLHVAARATAPGVRAIRELYAWPLALACLLVLAATACIRREAA